MTLEHLRKSLAVDVWSEFVDSPLAAQIRSRFVDDPYTRRGFEKPRGYAGDAVLLDYIYETAPLPDGTPIRGRKINKWMRQNSRAFQAVRHRRELLATHIDETIQANPSARILSIACGHLREFALCRFDPKSWRGELIAVDQDDASLAVVSSTYPRHSVVPTRMSILGLLKNGRELGKFDFVYAAGLLDYLDDDTVVQLAQWGRHALKPGGTMLLANFSQCAERGFMEAVMQWPLIYRDATQLSKLVTRAVERPVDSFDDPFEIVTYARTN